MRSRLFRRLRRGAMLAANVHHAAAFAGGYRAMIRAVWDLWRARGLGAVVGWAVTATSHGQHRDARRYRAWLTRRPVPPPPTTQGDVLIVASTLGVRDTHTYVAALISATHAIRAPLLLVTDQETVATPAIREGQRFSICNVATLSVSSLARAIRRSCQRSDFLAVLGPGCLPGEMRVPSPVRGKALLYGDEDCIDLAGCRSRPFFKPSFSPDLLCAFNYMETCAVLSRDLVLDLPVDAEIEDLHSFALILAERAEHICRLDAILAHRLIGMVDVPRAAGAQDIPAYLPTYLRRRYGPDADVATSHGALPWRCQFGGRAAPVSVILPTRDRLDLLRPCVEGVFGTNSGNFEVIILDNDSQDPETHAWFEEAQAKWDRLRVLSAPGSFNWSRLNNIGVAAAEGEVFVFLNNDTLPRTEEWLARLGDVAMRPDTGAVGALLLYDNGRIQHAGIVIGYGGCSDHVYRGAPLDSDEHMFVSPHMPRNVAAVTGACMAISRRTLEAIGPFDDAYPVAGNDVEICVRAMTEGYLNVYLPDVVLVHLESQTRGRRDPTADVVRLQSFLAEHCPLDPYYNPNLWMSSLYPSIPLWGERTRPRP